MVQIMVQIDGFLVGLKKSIDSEIEVIGMGETGREVENGLPVYLYSVRPHKFPQLQHLGLRASPQGMGDCTVSERKRLLCGALSKDHDSTANKAKLLERILINRVHSGEMQQRVLDGSHGRVWRSTGSAEKAQGRVGVVCEKVEKDLVPILVTVGAKAVQEGGSQDFNIIATFAALVLGMFVVLRLLREIISFFSSRFWHDMLLSCPLR